MNMDLILADLTPIIRCSRISTSQLQWHQPMLFSHLTGQDLDYSQTSDLNTKDNFLLIIKIGTFKSLTKQMV